MKIIYQKTAGFFRKFLRTKRFNEILKLMREIGASDLKLKDFLKKIKQYLNSDINNTKSEFNFFFETKVFKWLKFFL